MSSFVSNSFWTIWVERQPHWLLAESHWNLARFPYSTNPCLDPTQVQLWFEVHLACSKIVEMVFSRLHCSSVERFPGDVRETAINESAICPVTFPTWWLDHSCKPQLLLGHTVHNASSLGTLSYELQFKLKTIIQANRQTDWFFIEAPRRGWKPLSFHPSNYSTLDLVHKHSWNAAKCKLQEYTMEIHKFITSSR